MFRPWCLRGGMSFFILRFMLIQLGIMMSVSGADSETGRNFHCYNDLDKKMFCQFRPSSDHSNCSEYSLTMIDDTRNVESCNFQSEEGSVSECKCTFEMILVIYDTHNATLLRGGRPLESIVVDTVQTFKPKPPTITSVSKTEIGNIEVKWDTNYKGNSFQDGLAVVVIYRKKGDKSSTKETVTSSTSLEILKKKLEPNTVYVFTVQSYLDWKELAVKRLSDSSNEWEVTTPPSFDNVLVAIIASVCIFVFVAISIALACYSRLKAKYWDNVTKCLPKVMDMRPAEHRLLKPLPDILSSVYLDSPVKDPDEGKQWSGTSFTDTSDGNYRESCGTAADSSSGYAKTYSENVNIIDNVQAAMRQVLGHLVLPSSITDGAVTSPNDDGGVFFADYLRNNASPMLSPVNYDNKTYTMICGSDAMQAQPEMSYGPVCPALLRSGDISINTCPDPKTLVGLTTRPQGLTLQLGPSSPMLTDLSYQPCDVNSGSISQPENGRFTSSDSDGSASANVSPTESGYQSFSEAVRGGSRTPPEKTTGTSGEDTQACGGRLLPCFPPVDMDYQTCPSLVTQPDALFGAQQSNAADLGDLLDRVSKGFPHTSLGSVPPNGAANTRCGQQGPPGLELPCFLPTDHWKSIVTVDSCYHSV